MCSTVCVSHSWSGLILTAAAQARRSVSTAGVAICCDPRIPTAPGPSTDCGCLGNYNLRPSAVCSSAALITFPVLLCLGHLLSTLLLMLRSSAAPLCVHTACQVLLSLPAQFCGSINQVVLLFGVAPPYCMCLAGVCALANDPQRQNRQYLVAHMLSKMTLVLLS